MLKPPSPRAPSRAPRYHPHIRVPGLRAADLRRALRGPAPEDPPLPARHRRYLILGRCIRLAGRPLPQLGHAGDTGATSPQARSAPAGAGTTARARANAAGPAPPRLERRAAPQRLAALTAAPGVSPGTRPHPAPQPFHPSVARSTSSSLGQLPPASAS